MAWLERPRPTWVIELLGQTLARPDHPQREKIAEAIDSLLPHDRDALNMYYYEELTYAEIAEYYGKLSRETGRNRVKRAERELKRALRRSGFTFEEEE